MAINIGTKITVDPTLRRRFPRRSFRRRIGLLFMGNYNVSVGQEIGEGGLLLESQVELAVGATVVVTFFVSGSCFTVVTGEVLYKVKKTDQSKSKVQSQKNDQSKLNDQPKSKDQHYGLRFVDLTFESKRAIRDFIAEKSSNEAKQEKFA